MRVQLTRREVIDAIREYVAIRFDSDHTPKTVRLYHDGTALVEMREIEQSAE